MRALLKRSVHSTKTSKTITEFEFVSMKNGAILLMYEGHTYHKTNTHKTGVTYWRCSAKKKGCKVNILVNKDNTVITRIRGSHTHGLPNVCFEYEDNT